MTEPALEFPHEPQPIPSPRIYDRATLQPIDPERAGDLFEEIFARRLVAYTVVQTPDGTTVVVSTLFLGLDHAIDASPPILFETAVFDGSGMVWRARSRTEPEAREAHSHALEDLVGVLARDGLAEIERAHHEPPAETMPTPLVPEPEPARPAPAPESPAPETTPEEGTTHDERPEQPDERPVRPADDRLDPGLDGTDPDDDGLHPYGGGTLPTYPGT